MSEGRKVLVDGGNLRQLLQAIDGPGHHIRELQVTRGPMFGNPIDALIKEYNEQVAQQDETLTASDYEEVLADHRRLVRELDVLLNGEAGAAKQASLCDIVKQVETQGLQTRRGEPVFWNLVPIAPTTEMNDAYIDAIYKATDAGDACLKAHKKGYAAMLDARPTYTGPKP